MSLFPQIHKLYPSKANDITHGRSSDLLPVADAFPVSSTSGNGYFGTLNGAYSSGTVRDLHPIPFSFYTSNEVSKPMRHKGNTIYLYRPINT